MIMTTEREEKIKTSEGKTTYIHYGSDWFRTPNPIRNRKYFTKPSGGLWASRKDGDQTWKSWCECEEFGLDNLNYSFTFTLKDGARVLELSYEDQLENLPKLEPYDKFDHYSECRLDFEKLAEEYDAIEVTDISQLYWPLYGWDCNSIIVMNPKIIDIPDEFREESRWNTEKDADLLSR